MGKTYLLTHVAGLLSQRGCLVGYVESAGVGPDLMLRAVVDLYTFWLSQSSYGEQVKGLWEKYKGKLTVSVGRAVGTIFESLYKTVGLEPVGKLVREGIETLVRGVEDQRTGEMSLPKLDYEKARELVNFCASVSDKPIVLFLDAWDQSAIAVESPILVYCLLNSFNNWGIRSRFPCSVYFVENFLAVGVPDVAFWFQVMLC
jgi:hypothetical protein